MKELAQQIVQNSLDRGWDGICWQQDYPKQITCANPKWQPFFDEEYRLLVSLTKPVDKVAGQIKMML